MSFEQRMLQYHIFTVGSNGSKDGIFAQEGVVVGEWASLQAGPAAKTSERIMRPEVICLHLFTNVDLMLLTPHI